MEKGSNSGYKEHNVEFITGTKTRETNNVAERLHRTLKGRKTFKRAEKRLDCNFLRSHLSLKGKTLIEACRMV